MISRRRIVASSAVSMFLPLAGCAGLLNQEPDPPVEALDAEITDVRSPEPGLTSITIPVILEMKNTHPDNKIPSPTVEYEAFVNDKQVASAQRTITSLEPEDTSQEEFNLVVEYADVGSGIASTIQDGSFTIRIEGSVESKGATTTFETKYRL